MRWPATPVVSAAGSGRSQHQSSRLVQRERVARAVVVPALDLSTAVLRLVTDQVDAIGCFETHACRYGRAGLHAPGVARQRRVVRARQQVSRRRPAQDQLTGLAPSLLLVRVDSRIEVPAAFGGGNVDIRTRSIPNGPVFNIEIGSGLNSDSGDDGSDPSEIYPSGEPLRAGPAVHEDR